MNTRKLAYRIDFVLLAVLLGFAMLQLTATSVRVSAQQEDKPVEQVQKNIQVLKGLPSSQLLPVMQFMRSSLGVRCDYCHVAENGKYSLDDRPAKQTARRMLQMVFDINKANFGGQPVVTCNTCHRGSPKPVAVPPIGQGAFTNTTRADGETKAAEPLPSIDEVFDRYAQALGGRAAIDKIKTRAAKVTLLRPKLINSGTPNAAILNRAETWTIETIQKAPDKYLVAMTTPDGTIYQGFNGPVGWTKTPRGQREMTATELSRVKQQADLYFDIKLRDRYLKASVIGKEKLGEREVYVVDARSTENKNEKLYFETKSGLLVRRAVFTEIKLGVDLEQTDYEDYRAVDGVWIPFIVRTSFLDDNHFGTTRTIIEIKQNIGIDDARFDAPR